MTCAFNKPFFTKAYACSEQLCELTRQSLPEMSKIRRNPQRRFWDTKNAILFFVAAMLIIGTLNLAPTFLKFENGEHILATQRDDDLATDAITKTYADPDGKEIVEHDFSGVANVQVDEELTADELLDAQEEQEEKAEEEDPLPPANSAVTQKEATTSARSPDEQYHVVMTVEKSVYNEWQARMGYYHYKKLKEKHPDSAMGGFTRLMHSGEGDDWMDEIPSVVVDPLPPSMDSVIQVGTVHKEGGELSSNPTYCVHMLRFKIVIHPMIIFDGPTGLCSAK